MSVLNRIVKVASSLVRDAVRTTERRVRATNGPRPRPAPAGTDSLETAHTTVPFEGELPPLQYEPEPDNDADPGEIVWAWVPYDENDGRGKDRPVLIIARQHGGYLGLQTTSKDHDRDRADEARWGRFWYDIGSGAWDSQGRESEVRLDRVLYLPTDAIRREGAGLDKSRYDAVAQALAALRAEQARSRS